jgi:hypothetical protein
MKMIAIECFSLLIVLLLLAPTTVDADKKYRKFECSAKKSKFETYLYLDIKLKSKLKESQVKELELVVKSTYNDFIKKNYCDVFERQISDIDASFREKRNDTIYRYLLHIQGTCRDCASDSKIFSTESRRMLATENSLLKTGKKSSSRTCQCPMDVSFGTPSTPHYTPYVKEKIVQKMGSRLQISIQSHFSLSEVRPIQCGDESSFEASAQMLFTSDMPANMILGSDLDQVEIGWKQVYNDLQQGICDAQFKRIEQVDATIKFLSRASNTRSLQVSGVKYVIVLNTAMRGKCRSCKGQTSLLKNDAIKTRVIEKSTSDLSNLCFCSEGSGSLRSSTFLTTSQFTKAFNQWLQEERKKGRIRDLMNVTKTVDLLDSEPISLPPSQFALPSTVPVPPTRKPVVPKTLPPTAKPVAKTKSPTPMIIPPSASPSHQSLEPSLVPIEVRCTPSGLVIPEPVPSLCGSQESNVVLLFQTFEDCTASGWDEAAFHSTIPEMTNFLGLYNGNSLSPEFTFSGLDVITIKSLTISLDFYEINQWGLEDGIEDFFALKLNGDVEDIIRFGSFQMNVTEVPRSGKTEQGSIDWAISSQPTVTLADSMVEIYQTHNISMVVPLSFFTANATIKVKVEWRLPGIINKFVGIDNFMLAACV